VLEIGEEIQVQLTEIDKKTGKYRLSRKVLLPKPDGSTGGSNGGGGERRSSSDRNDRNRRPDNRRPR
jgi:polyribonucleotide nucleotidyltransferase